MSEESAESDQSDGDPDKPDGDERIKIIYEEAVRGWSLQSSVLDELRSRTGVLLAAASVAVALLGSSDISKHEGFTTLGWFAIGTFGVTLGLCLYVLVPTGGWIFTNNVHLSLKGYIEEDRSLDDTREGLAIKAEEYRDANNKKLRCMFLAFQGASLALGVSIVLWLIDLN
jgi:hypothetical protein